VAPVAFTSPPNSAAIYCHQICAVLRSRQQARYPEDGSEAEDLLKHATEAMLAAKLRGPGCIQFFTVEMSVRAARYLKLSHHLRNVLESGELTLEYQPLLSMATGKVVTVEALLRWHSPALGIVPPEEFLPLTEDSGAIVAIDDWVLAAACRQARTWQDEGLPEVHMAVNLSERSFRHPQLTQRVGQILAQCGLAAEWLELEIAERVLMSNAEESVRILVSLKTLGVRLSMDDFGSDLSPLSFLSYIPIDFLKIDRSRPLSPWRRRSACASLPRASRPVRNCRIFPTKGATSCRATISAGPRRWQT